MIRPDLEAGRRGSAPCQLGSNVYPASRRHSRRTIATPRQACLSGRVSSQRRLSLHGRPGIRGVAEPKPGKGSGPPDKARRAVADFETTRGTTSVCCRAPGLFWLLPAVGCFVCALRLGWRGRRARGGLAAQRARSRTLTVWVVSGLNRMGLALSCSLNSTRTIPQLYCSVTAGVDQI